MEAKIFDKGDGAWSRADRDGWDVAVFDSIGSAILSLDTKAGRLNLQHEPDTLVEYAPKVAALYGVDLDGASIRAALECCNAALAAHAISIAERAKGDREKIEALEKAIAKRDARIAELEGDAS